MEQQEKIRRYFYKNFKKHIHLRGYNYAIYLVEHFNIDLYDLTTFCNSIAEEFGIRGDSFKNTFIRFADAVQPGVKANIFLRCIQEDIKLGIERSENYE